MPYRSNKPRCPECGDPAVGYDPIWDYLRCKNGHRWNGPVNDPKQRGKTLPETHGA